MNIKHALLWAAFVLLGCDSGPVNDPPPPFHGSPSACELSADCPAGTHCDLGECVQDCNQLQACTGDQACTARGRCVTASGLDRDPTPPASNPVTLSAPGLSIDGRADAATLAVDATPADLDVRYRLESRVPWLEVVAPRGTFRGSLRAQLAVHRDGLEPGPHAGSVVVHSSAGDVVVPVVLAQALDGVYEGGAAYTSPREIGHAPLRIEVRQTAAGAELRIEPTRSPLFPLHGGNAPTTSATYDAGVLRGSFTQVLTPFDLGSERFLDRSVGRVFSFELRPSAGGGLAGSFTERWIGLLPQPFEVSGSLTLARLAGESVSTFTVGSPDALPANPGPVPPSLTSECIQRAQDASGLVCNSAASATDLGRCGDAIERVGATLEQGTGLDIVRDGGYQRMTDACAQDLAPSAPTAVTSTAVACIRPANQICARSLYGLAGAIGPLARLVSDRTGVGLLLVNQDLVDAFALPYRSAVADGAVATGMIADLDDARAKALATLRPAFDPYVLAMLDRADAGVDDHRALRRLAQLVGRLRLASDERANLLLRAVGTDAATVRAELAQEALNLLVALATLAEIERAQAAPASPELGLASYGLSQLSHQAVAVGTDEDVLGLPPGFVPFLYDPTQASPDRASNFDFVLSGHLVELSQALADETAAQNAVRDLDHDQTALENELQQLAVTSNVKLVGICGALAGSPLTPDVDHCGSSTGDMRLALDDVLQADQGRQLAMARIEALHARIQIETQRLMDTQHVRADEIAFVDDSDQRIEALTAEQDEISMYQEMIDAASSLFGFVTDALTFQWDHLTSDAVAFIDGVCDTLADTVKRKLDEQKQHLQHMQQLKSLDANRQVEFINGMATIKELLIQGDELNIELTQAELRLASSLHRVATLKQQVDTARAESQLEQSYAGNVGMGQLNDPAMRVLAQDAVATAMASREQALRGIYQAARALEYEINFSFSPIATDLVPALRAQQIERFKNCMLGQYTAFHTAFGVRSTYVDEISLRRHILGIRGPIVDTVTGQTIDEAEQFRRRLLQPSNLGPDGTVGLSFATTLDPGNGVTSTGVCNDQIRTVQVKLIGDGLGDDQARVKLAPGGNALMRSCASGRDGQGDLINEYKLQVQHTFELQAGVNAYPSSPPDAQLFGRSLAHTQWKLAIPAGSAAPQNADLDLEKIEDIVLRIEHSGISLSDSPLSFDPICR